MRPSILRPLCTAILLAAPIVGLAEEFDHPADCWLKVKSAYRLQPGVDFRGTPPLLSDVHAWMRSLAVKYTIPVEVIAAVCFQESSVRQWEDPSAGVPRGFLIHNLNECRTAYATGEISPGLPPPPGLGLMQLTSITATDTSIANHDPVKDITDWKYNLEAGVQVLNQKYEIARENSDQNGQASNNNPAVLLDKLADPESRKILENWYYAIKFYNGAPTSDQYRDLVYGHVQTPEDRIQNFFPPVRITPAPEVIPNLATIGPGFAVERSGTWTDRNSNTYQGSLHVSTTFSGDAAVDFGGQTHNDVLFQNNSTGQRAAWLLNGSTYVQGAVLPSIGVEWQIVGTGDFDGDGKTDIVFQHSSTYALAVWLMSYNTRLGIVGLPTPTGNFKVATVGDFNGDGKPDLVFQQDSTGRRIVWFMDGVTRTSAVAMPSVAAVWNIVGSGDFNGDGRADLVFQNASTGAASLWYMNGATQIGTAILSTPPANWKIAGTGDFNIDGKRDLVLQNVSTGDRMVWLMNGNVRASSVALPRTPAAWDIRNH